MAISSKPPVLMLAHRIPYPPDKGDKIRSYNLLRHLAKRFDVYLGAFIDVEEDERYANNLDEFCVETCLLRIHPTFRRIISLRAMLSGRPLSFEFYRDRRLFSFVEKVRSERTLAAEIGFCSAMMPYFSDAKAPVLADMVDADSAKFAAYAEDGNALQKWVYEREASLLAKEEAGAVAANAKTFFVTPEEAALIADMPGVDAARVDYFRNGVDLAYWHRDAAFPAPDQVFDVVFTGAMNYKPNVDAVVGFVANVWPMLRKRYPDLTFGIVGSSPNAAVQKLASEPGVSVTGRVPDMRSYLASARVAVAPLNIARGIQNKVLEALAMGTPMVASSHAILGTGAVDGQHLVQADTSEQQMSAISALLDAPEEARTLGACGARFIHETYDWSKTLERFDGALNSAVSVN